MTISIHRLRIIAKANRGEACFKYMQTRTTPVTLKEMAGILRVNPKAVDSSLQHFLADGRVQRIMVLRQSSICSRLVWAYGYYVTERKEKVKKVRLPKFNFHDPFNMGARA
jgi:hypothetical protein